MLQMWIDIYKTSKLSSYANACKKKGFGKEMFIKMSVKYAMAIIFIIICSICDIRKKEVPVLLIGAFGVLSLIVTAIIQETDLFSFLYSLIPGASMLALGLCTRESIGYGDGFVVLVLGILLGFEKCIFAVFAGFLLSTVGGLVLLILQKVSGKSQIPFIPFLAAGLGAAIFV